MSSTLLRGFLIKYALVAQPVVAALVFYAVSTTSAAHKADVEDQTHQVTALRGEILTLLNSAKSDVIILEQSQEIKSYLYKPILINEAIVQYRLRNFMLSIETPWKPMIRIATPLADRFGHKAGVLEANVDATALLNEFEVLFNGDSSALRLMNDEGYWIFHPDASKSFGFMTGIETSMVEKDLKAWNVMTLSDRGKVDSSSGHYVYDTIKVVDESSMRFALDEDIDRWWKVVAFTPNQSVMSDVLDHFGWVVLFGPVFLLASGLFS